MRILQIVGALLILALCLGAIWLLVPGKSVPDTVAASPRPKEPSEVAASPQDDKDKLDSESVKKPNSTSASR